MVTGVAIEVTLEVEAGAPLEASRGEVVEAVWAVEEAAFVVDLGADLLVVLVLPLSYFRPTPLHRLILDSLLRTRISLSKLSRVFP